MRNLNKKNIKYRLMSGNRANASAIQRRTNNPQPVRNTQPSSSSRYTPPPPPQQANPKLSVSDAIALITIRLGRVETFINQLPPLDQLESFSSSHTEESSNNMSLVNDNVFQSIITRLEKLETDRATSLLEKKSLESIISSLEQKINILQSEPKHINTSQKDTIQKDTTQIDDKINFLNEEIVQLKDTVLSLQTYTMNTNTKLIDLIITNTEMNENQDETENISNEELSKHLEKIFKHNFENLDSEINNDNSSNLFEEDLTENTINQLTLNESDLSNLSINI
jgi:hypothetical protein